MYYIVFSRNRDSDGLVLSRVHYKGVSKSTAIEKFTTIMPSSFNITALSGTLNLVGFESDLSFIEELGKPTTSDRDCINIILRNMGLATCSNTLSTSGYKPKITVVHECTECDTTNITVQKNVYGNYLCSECWAKYWTSRESLAEYVIGLANGTYNADSFSDADKEAIVEAWLAIEYYPNGKDPKKSNRSLLSEAGLTDETLDAIESASGLFAELR